MLRLLWTCVTSSLAARPCAKYDDSNINVARNPQSSSNKNRASSVPPLFRQTTLSTFHSCRVRELVYTPSSPLPRYPEDFYHTIFGHLTSQALMFDDFMYREAKRQMGSTKEMIKVVVKAIKTWWKEYTRMERTAKLTQAPNLLATTLTTSETGKTQAKGGKGKGGEEGNAKGKGGKGKGLSYKEKQEELRKANLEQEKHLACLSQADLEQLLKTRRLQLWKEKFSIKNVDSGSPHFPMLDTRNRGNYDPFIRVNTNILELGRNAPTSSLEEATIALDSLPNLIWYLLLQPTLQYLFDAALHATQNGGLHLERGLFLQRSWFDYQKKIWQEVVEVVSQDAELRRLLFSSSDLKTELFSHFTNLLGRKMLIVQRSSGNPLFTDRNLQILSVFVDLVRTEMGGFRFGIFRTKLDTIPISRGSPNQFVSQFLLDVKKHSSDIQKKIYNNLKVLHTGFVTALGNETVSSDISTSWQECISILNAPRKMVTIDGQKLRIGAGGVEISLTPAETGLLNQISSTSVSPSEKASLVKELKELINERDLKKLNFFDPVRQIGLIKNGEEI